MKNEFKIYEVVRVNYKTLHEDTYFFIVDANNLDIIGNILNYTIRSISKNTVRHMYIGKISNKYSKKDIKTMRKKWPEIKFVFADKEYFTDNLRELETKYECDIWGEVKEKHLILNDLRVERFLES